MSLFVLRCCCSEKARVPGSEWPVSASFKVEGHALNRESLITAVSNSNSCSECSMETVGYSVMLVSAARQGKSTVCFTESHFFLPAEDHCSAPVSISTKVGLQSSKIAQYPCFA
ncbi:hypothetical protein BAUCODRAFT_550980 [Baudoinia panamericana UAMH 10762]|uniref:Uncharacterized protein n=1 Tax=Baudoinia panamericana (strain UAMH 10762) TaxID=717646 RepID=M2N6Y2_BAUPA|nr:uncharacterized protein BAUCODRAFT_550980 [Baudoinia panamericana UAMH 10762]EMC94530.1 hypothetical protein BAUCODRAFT_550980 [Baudoinia panamericana UAMH 10762]